MTPADVARIVECENGATLVDQLREADAAFEDQFFESLLADALRAEPRLAYRWATWSADQRWSPSAYVEKNETGWYDAGYRHVRQHSDQAEAVADFIRRMSAWLARRHVVTFDD